MNIVILTAVAVVSGLLTGKIMLSSWLAGDNSEGWAIILSLFVPGIGFSLALLLSILRNRFHTTKERLSFIFTAIWAWLVALILTIFSISLLIFTSGTIGAYIVARAIRKRIPGFVMYPSVIAGLVAGFVAQGFYSSWNGEQPTSGWPIYAAAVLWQVLVGLTIARSIKQSDKPIQELPITDSSTRTIKVDTVLKYGIAALGLMIILAYYLFVHTCYMGGGC